MQLPGFHGMGLLEVVRKSVSDFIDDDMSTYASALAYQVLFSIFPFIIFLIALLGFFHLPQFFDWLREQGEYFLPEQATQPVNAVIVELQRQSGGLLSVGVLLALWSASAAVRATMNALNVAYDVEEGRPAWKLYPLSIIYTIGIAAMLILAAALMVVGPQAMQWLAQKFGVENIFVTLWTWLRLPIALGLMMLVVAVIYYVAPNVKQRFRVITPGAVVAVVVWAAISIAFDLYVKNFSNYSAMYGSIGAIIVLLLYFFISAAVLLLGAEVNAVIDGHGAKGVKPREERLREA
jgi:membrane protein